MGKAFLSTLGIGVTIATVRNLFDNDNDKIVSKEGEEVLSDPKKMEKVNNALEENRKNGRHEEIILDL